MKINEHLAKMYHMCTGVTFAHVPQHVACRELCRANQVEGAECCERVLDAPILGGLYGII